MMRFIFIIAGLLILSSPAEGREVSRTGFVEDINILFLKGDYKGLVKSAEDLRRQRLGGREKKEVLYLAGLSCLELGDYGKAREFFYGLTDIGGEDYREEAYIAIADSYFKERKTEKAIASYCEALSRYPRSDRLAGIYYNLGLCYKEEGKLDKAEHCFNKVKGEHKTSFEAGELSDVLSAKLEPDFYIIQLGAFGSIRNAKKLVSRLVRKGYDSYIQKAGKGRGALYKVRGGKFSNKGYARSLLCKLKRDGFAAKIVEE